MNFKEYVKKLVASRPDLAPKHGLPMNRRELLAQGYISMGAFAAMPSALSILSSKAYGADDDVCSSKDSDGNEAIPFLVVDLGGGANIPAANVLVGGPGGQTDYLAPASYATTGLTESGARSLDADTNSEFGLKFHTESAILDGMRNFTSTGARGKTDGAIFCTSSQDDTSGNPFNPTYWVAKAGAKGKVVSLVGTEDSTSGGRSIAPNGSIAPADKPVRVTSPGGATGLVLPGKLAELLGDKGVQRIMNETKKMSSRKLAQFQKQDVNSQVSQLLGCAYSGSIDQISKYSAEDVNPENDTAITGGLDNNDDGQQEQAALFNLNDGNDRQAASIAKLVLDGYAGAGTIQMGGYDYHNNDRADTDQRDRQAGQIIGKLLELANRKNKSLMVYVITDGGIGCDGPDPGSDKRTRPSSDSGSRGSNFILVHKAKGDGRPNLRNGLRQIGHFNDSGAVEEGALKTSNSVPNLTRAIVANYLALHGREGDLGKIVDQDPFGRELDKYLAFGKII